MRLPRFVVTAVLVALLAPPLLVPTTAAADTFSFRVGKAELTAGFGLTPFEVSDQVVDVGVPFMLSNMFATLVSGPLLDLGVDAVNGLTTYSYDAGTFALTMTVDDEHGNPVTGNFLATTLPFSFVVCEGCDSLHHNGLASDFLINLVEGVFDEQLAHALGIQSTATGSIDFGLEDITGDPTTESRRGADHRGYAELQIDVAEAPEPSLVALLLAGAAATYGRRGISRARTSARR